MDADKQARTLAKLETALASGDYYGALQLYRTLVKRQLDAGAFTAAASLVASGVGALARHARAPEGADLIDMLVKTLAASGEAATPERVAALEACAAAFPLGDAKAAAAAVPAIASAVRWVSQAPLRAGGAPAGEESAADAEARRKRAAPLHAAAAAAAAAAGGEFYADAARHYLEADAPAAFGAFLYGWARGAGGARGGYAGEGDLFLARAVLQLLCLGRLGDANATRDAFAAAVAAGAGESGADWVAATLDSPLAHWTQFALLTAERDAGPLWALLAEKYKPALARDPTFAPLLATAAHRLFGTEPPKGKQEAMLEGLMNGPLGAMLGGGGGSRAGGAANPLAAIMNNPAMAQCGRAARARAPRRA